jgi:hypothetical protein
MVKMQIVDTYAWIEYFIGSKKGEKAAVKIDDPNEPLITVECCLAEIRGWTLREGQNFKEIYARIKSNSEILRVFTRMWIRAAEIRHEVRKTVPQLGHFGAHLFTFVISTSRRLSFSARRNAAQLRLSSNMCLTVRGASVVRQRRTMRKYVPGVKVSGCTSYSYSWVGILIDAERTLGYSADTKKL